VPDANKLAKMRARGYRIVESCGTCEHAVRGDGGYPMTVGWATCLETYDHEKHDERNMPAHTAFVCENYDMADWAKRNLGVYLDEPWKEADSEE
jgi:hypothetical protein